MDSYGLFKKNPTKQLDRLNARLENLMSRGASSPQAQGRIAKIMAKRDQLIARGAAEAGAQMAAAQTGGLPASGIRGATELIESEFTPDVIRQHNISGAQQGQRFSSAAPPGSGRLTRIPFVQAAATNPVQTVVGGAAAIGATTNLFTRSVNWAVMRIVALTTQSTPAAVGVIGVMQDFKTGGGPNLFLNEDWVVMDDYDTDKDEFAGLRAYPVLISPNTAQVDVAAFAPASQTLYSVVSLVVDVLRDDAFGPGLPGPYAR